MRMLITALVLVAALTLSASAQTIIWERSEQTSSRQTYFDQEHHEEYVREVLRELTGKPPRPDATREELAGITLEILNELRPYGERRVAMVQPEIPEWVLRGYAALQPSCVSKSRYLNGVIDGSLAPDADIATLYAYWCIYDAEWFALSRNADYKAWTSAVLLNYPPMWMAMRGSAEAEMVERIVKPLQTPDEPYRELSNWINAYTKSEQAFAKPKVRDALVEELLKAAGNEADERFYSEEAYLGFKTSLPGLSEQEFYMLAALAVEFSQEIYEIDPETKQLLHFRDFFIAVFDSHLNEDDS